MVWYNISIAEGNVTNGTMPYNCTIIDLSECEKTATLNSNYIGTELAKETLRIALTRRNPTKGITLYSGQGP